MHPFRFLAYCKRTPSLVIVFKKSIVEKHLLTVLEVSIDRTTLQYRIFFMYSYPDIPRYFFRIHHPDFKYKYYLFLFNAIHFLNFSSTSAWNRTTFSKCTRFGQCNQWKWFRNVSIPWRFYDKIIWHFAIMK